MGLPLTTISIVDPAKQEGNVDNLCVCDCHTLTGNQPYSTSLAQLCHLHPVTWQTLQNKDTSQTAQHICLFHNIRARSFNNWTWWQLGNYLRTLRTKVEVLTQWNKPKNAWKHSKHMPHGLEVGHLHISTFQQI